MVKTEELDKTSNSMIFIERDSALSSEEINTRLNMLKEVCETGDDADKILLYPLLGGTMVSVYYAATVFSKVVSLAITPINSVALSYLSKINKKTNSLFKWTYIVGIVVCGIGYIMTIILSRPVLSILYPKYVDAAMQYIWITSGTIVVSVLTSMITPFVLRFFDIKWQIWINGITTIMYIIISLSLLKLGGLMGFCVGAYSI